MGEQKPVILTSYWFPSFFCVNRIATPSQQTRLGGSVLQPDSVYHIWQFP